MPQFVDFQEFSENYNGSVGLVVGPAITASPEISKEARSFFSASKNIDSNDISSYVLIPFLEEHGRKHSKSADELRVDAKDFLLGLEYSSGTKHLSKGRWAGVVSLAPDSLLDDLLRINIEQLPTTREVALIDEPGSLPPKRCLPIYKLLGNARSSNPRSGVLVTRLEHDIKIHQWAGMMHTLPDHIQNKPILVVGLDGYKGLFSRFINAIIALGQIHPRNFLLLDGDRLTHECDISALEAYGIKFTILRGDSSTIIRYLADQFSQPSQMAIDLSVDDKSLVLELAEIGHTYARSVMFVVPMNMTETNLRRRRVQLTDALFRPAALDFEPYFYQLNLPRSFADEIISQISEANTSTRQRLNIISVRGDAGSGKSSLLKEICSKLATAGLYCFWLSPSGSQVSQNDLSRIVDRLNEVSSQHEELSQIVFFMDDALERFPLHDLCRELEKIKLKVSLILAFRNADLISDTGIAYPTSWPIDAEYVMPNELDDTELSQLPRFLVSVGVAESDDNASKQVAALRTRNARDVLCVLWYLIPSTRRALSDSLENQYLSLGDVNGVIRALAEDAARLSMAAKKAWEICAVASSLQMGVPVEILVRAIEISWDEWVEMCKDGAPLWGLVYPEEQSDGGAVLFWTRNEVVTTVLIRLINGGHGHAGEIPILTRIIQACDAGTDVYRDFLFEIFVRRRKVLGDRYTLEQGRSLFLSLFSTLPYEDKAFQHQYGLWLKDKGADLSEAIKELRGALETKDSPGASVAERDEYIRTSIAASVVQQAKKNERSLGSALEEVQENLRYTRTTSYLDPHASHVFGTLLLELAQMHADEGDRKSQLAAVADGLAVIERTFQLGGSSSGWGGIATGDKGMLASLQERLVATFDDERELEAVAHRLVRDHASQAGFVVLGRKKLLEAVKLGKGTAFNHARECLDRFESYIEDAGLDLSSRFRSLRVDLYIRWQIQREGCSVEWPRIVSDLQELLNDPLFSRDSVKVFYLAVGLFHLNRYEEANVLFSQLRSTQMLKRIKGSARCFYQGETGFPKRMPGIAKHSHSRWYFESIELKQDVPLRDAGDSCVDGVSLNCYIGFSFFGPFAIRRKPARDEFELPA